MAENGQDNAGHNQMVNRLTCVCADGVRMDISLTEFKKHSGYFSALHRFEEFGSRQVCLQLVSGKLLSQIQQLIRVLDSGQFELTIDLEVFKVISKWEDNDELENLLTTIDYLDIHTLRSRCDRYFCSLFEVDSENCLYLIHLCNQFSFTQLEKKLLSFLSQNASKSDIFDITSLPFKLLKDLIQSEKADLSSEWDAVDLIDKWCMTNGRNNLTHSQIMELCWLLRISQLLKHKKLEQQLQRICYGPLKNGLKTALCDFKEDPQKCYTIHPYLSVPRRGCRLLLAMRVPFGNKLDGTCSFSPDFNTESNKDLVFTESATLSQSVPCDSLREFSVCAVDQYVYIVGGQRKYSLSGQFAVGHVYRLDLDTLTWNTMSSLSVSRCLFYLDCVGRDMYAVGGINEEGELASVECYNSVSDQWSTGHRLNYAIHEHAGSVNGGNLYISGGHDGTGHVDTLSRYSSATDTWSRCAPMLSTRSCHSMVCLNSKLFVIGGCRIKKNRVYGVQNIECYSIASDQWSEVAAPFPSVYTVCLSVHPRPLSGRLLVLGGYSYKCRKYTPSSKEFHSFCERTCSWSKVPFQFNSSHKSGTDVTIIEVRVTRPVANKLIRSRRSCTLK